MIRRSLIASAAAGALGFSLAFSPAVAHETPHRVHVKQTQTIKAQATTIRNLRATNASLRGQVNGTYAALTPDEAWNIVVLLVGKLTASEPYDVAESHYQSDNYRADSYTFSRATF